MLDSDDGVVGDERSEPVEEVEDLRAGDAWEEVFVASREADDFVGKDRSDDEEDVVVGDVAIDFDGDGFGHQPAGDFAGFLRGEVSEKGEGLGVVPLVIEESGLSEELIAFKFLDAEEFADLGLGHGGMCSEGDHDIEVEDMGTEVFEERIKEEWEGGGSGSVGNDEEDFFAFVFVERNLGGDELADLIGGEEGVLGGHGKARSEWSEYCGTCCQDWSSG